MTPTISCISRTSKTQLLDVPTTMFSRIKRIQSKFNTGVGAWNKLKKNVGICIWWASPKEAERACLISKAKNCYITCGILSARKYPWMPWFSILSVGSAQIFTTWLSYKNLRPSEEKPVFHRAYSYMGILGIGVQSHPLYE